MKMYNKLSDQLRDLFPRAKEIKIDVTLEMRDFMLLQHEISEELMKQKFISAIPYQPLTDRATSIRTCPNTIINLKLEEK